NALISGLVEGELTVLAAAEDALAARGNLDCIQFPAICSAQTGFLDQIVQHIDEEGIVPMPKDADIHWYYAGKVAGDTGVFMIGIVQGTAGMLTILAGIGVGVGGGGAGVLGAPETGGASLTLSYVSLETAAVAIPAGATIATAGISTGAVGSGNFQSDLSDWKNSFNQQNGNNTGGGSSSGNNKGFTGGNSKTISNTKIDKNLVRVDVEFPTGGSSGNVHIQIKGSGIQGGQEKIFLNSPNDLQSLPKSIRNNPEVQRSVNKAFDLLSRYKP
ncbi:MAG: hypothetical protein HEQ14_20010, partial [Aphanizomenon flos-aquae CP01]|nr:hypothetical protein [Aphanizomenon flos-aquae CP01]